MPQVSAALPGIAPGELLCQAFEVYRQLVNEPQFSSENLAFLVSALADGVELTLACCQTCARLTVVDPISLRERLCPHSPSQVD